MLSSDAIQVPESGAGSTSVMLQHSQTLMLGMPMFPLTWMRSFGPSSCKPFSGGYGMPEMVKFSGMRLLLVDLLFLKCVMIL
jgi:hypothetical protein